MVVIDKITDAGVSGKERLVLKATAADNIGRYVVFDVVQKTPGKVSSTPRNTYWFPDKNVKASDLIVLYTGPGVDKSQVNASGTTTHFFHWRKSSSLWSSGNSGAALLKVESWSYKIRP